MIKKAFDGWFNKTMGFFPVVPDRCYPPVQTVTNVQIVLLLKFQSKANEIHPEKNIASV